MESLLHIYELIWLNCFREFITLTGIYIHFLSAEIYLVVLATSPLFTEKKNLSVDRRGPPRIMLAPGTAKVLVGPWLALL